ncbi:histidine kinase [bacterium SCSIO 12741]|nr:histidine kinase [bacterium SCSIO 12741]
MRNISHYLCLCLIVLLLPGVTIGQNDEPGFIYQNIGLENGLPSSECYRVVQDAIGYLWIATDRGVCRYDGRQIQVFSETDGLCDNTILTLVARKDSTLLFWGFNGKLCGYKNDHFFPLNFADSVLAQFKDSLTRVTADLPPQGWIQFTVPNSEGRTTFYYDRFFRLQRNEKESNFVVHLSEFSPFTEIHIQHHPDHPVLNVYWNETKIGSWSLDRFKEEATGVQVFQVADEEFIVGIQNRLYRTQKGQITHSLVLPGRICSRFFTDKQQNLWLGLDGKNGCLRIDPRGLKLEGSSYLSGYSISSILEDHEGNMWFSTLENGVFQRKAELYQNIPSEEMTHLIHLDDTLASIGEDGRVFNLSRKTNFVSLEPKNYSVLPRTVMFNQDGKIYGAINPNIPQELSPAKNGVINMHSWVKPCGYKDSLLWSSIGNLLITHQLKSGKILQDTLPSRIMSLVLDHQQRLWIGTLNGLYVYDYLSRSHQAVSTDLLWLRGRINDLISLKDSSLIVATHGNGIGFLTPNGHRQLTTQNGLISNTILRMSKNLNGDLWLSTNQGIARLKKSSNGYLIDRMITESDGLISNEVNDVIQVHDTLFAATKKGISVLSLQALPAHDVPIVCADVFINGEKVSIQSDYHLPPSSKRVTLQFSGISLGSSDKLQYKIQFDHSREQEMFQKSGQLSFDLTPGDKSVTIWASDGNGRWSEHPIQIRFFIASPFWQTWPFWLAIQLIIAILIYSIIKRRNQKARRKLAIQEELYQARLEATNSQMNPHFIFNSLNSIQMLIWNENKKLAAIQVARFSKLIRTILHNSRKKWIHFQEELDALNMYLELEQFRTKEKFDYEIKVDPEVNLSDYLIPPLLLQPFVENAIWHGVSPKSGRGLIQLNLNSKGDQICCSIIDDGVGRKFHSEKQKESKSLGTKLSQERITLLNQLYETNIRFEIEDLYDGPKPMGTRVTFFIPKIKQTLE